MERITISVKFASPKLPMPHSTKLRRFSCEDLNCRMLTMAEVKWPSMIPNINRLTWSFKRYEKGRMMNITAIAPTSAANVIEKVPAMPAAAPPMMASATPSEAPLEIPRMDGPASGLRKSVCMSHPLKASAMPPVRAVSALGNRDSKMITLIFSSA